MILLRPTLTCLLAGGIICAAPAADTVASAATTLNQADIAFLQKAHACNQHELRASRLAVERRMGGAAQTFAQQMVEQHQAIDRDLAELARSKNVTLASQDADRERKAQKKYDDLAANQGADFTEDYLEMQVDAHEKAVEAFSEIDGDGQDGDVKAFAARHLATLRSHLEEARRLESAQ